MVKKITIGYGNTLPCLHCGGNDWYGWRYSWMEDKEIIEIIDGFIKDWENTDVSNNIRTLVIGNLEELKEKLTK